MEQLQTIWKLSIQSGKFPDILYRQFSNLKEIFEVFRPSILSRLCGKLPDKTKTFQTIQKRSRQSVNFPDDPETYQKHQ